MTNVKHINLFEIYSTVQHKCSQVSCDSRTVLVNNTYNWQCACPLPLNAGWRWRTCNNDIKVSQNFGETAGNYRPVLTIKESLNPCT